MVEAGLVEARGEPGFSDSHTDRVTKALAERTGGDFDADGVAAFGMAGSFAAPLAEALEFIEREIIAGKMEQAVEQHGAVTRGENEAITVRPMRIFGVELQILCPKRVCHGGRAHRHSGVTGVGVLDTIGCKEADGVNAKVFKCS